jgi:hypothetical protein
MIFLLIHSFDPRSGRCRAKMAKELVVFSQDGCPYCEEAITVLSANSFAPRIVKVNKAQREVLEDLTGVVMA